MFISFGGYFDPLLLAFWSDGKVNCMQSTPVNIIVGSHVWIEDQSVAWIDGQVSQINGQDVQVQTSDGKKVCYLFYARNIILFLQFQFAYLFSSDNFSVYYGNQ